MENNTEEKTRDPEHGDRVEWAGMIRPKSRGTVIWYGVKEGWDHPSVAVLWDHHPEGPLVHYKWIPGKGASWVRFLPVLDSQRVMVRI